jgi:predicted transcriptional regulator of viral defense system
VAGGCAGTISHDSALDLWEVGDVNPAKIHITVPRAHRVQRDVPAAYELHCEDLAADEVTEIEGVRWSHSNARSTNVTLPRSRPIY